MTASTAYARQPEMLVVAPNGYSYSEADCTIEEFEQTFGFQGVKVGYKTAPLSPANVRVGDGVTFGIGSDSYAGTVVSVSPSGKEFRWVHDEARQVGDYYQNQKWEYTPGHEITWSDVQTHATSSNAMTARWSVRRGHGAFRHGGRVLVRGRHEHRDPSF